MNKYKISKTLIKGIEGALLAGIGAAMACVQSGQTNRKTIITSVVMAMIGFCYKSMQNFAKNNISYSGLSPEQKP